MCSDRYMEIVAFEKQAKSTLWQARAVDGAGAKLYRTKHGPDRGEPYVLERMSSLPRPEWILKGTSCHYEIALIAGEATAQWAFERGFTQAEISHWWSMYVRSPCTVKDGWPWSAKARWVEVKVRADRLAAEEARWRHKHGMEPIGKTLARKEHAKKQAVQYSRQRRQAAVGILLGIEGTT